MRVIVVHEDGDRLSRSNGLATELRNFIAKGSSYSVICQGVEVQAEDELQ